MRKLERNASDESARPADITAASREEKAGTQMLPCIIPARNRACNCCFASASQAAQPKNVLLTLPICPFVYSIQEINAGVGEARGIVLRGDRVVTCAFCVRQAGDKIFCSLTASVKRLTLLQSEN
jgi:hypothetical protein